ncbi:gag-polypeptide of LTR copia-type [Phytophthora infestans]|uniref:Gag-polypeptide of LTR copia-type n=1 Tax=Phytophthora infestans TaxID=4787 RepID=A0A833SJZ1_PHYIN|nr:gag-polypeptide of LTR copia-type [Phytophthora infestans]
MEIAFEDKNVLEYASGTKTLASNATDGEKSKFKEGQVKVKQTIMSSLSMELGQQVMMKKTLTEMWKYLMDTYEGTTNAAPRTNQEIIMYNKLQAAKCKPNWDVRLHVNNMFLIKEQLAAINADSSGISTKTELPEKAAAIATKKWDQQQSNCFRCHKPGHQQKDCPKKSLTSTNAPKAKQATYTKRLEKGENPKQSMAPVVPEQTSPVSAPDTSADPVPVTTATPDI